MRIDGEVTLVASARSVLHGPLMDINMILRASGEGRASGDIKIQVGETHPLYKARRGDKIVVIVGKEVPS